MEHFKVACKDRAFQFFKECSLSVPLFTDQRRLARWLQHRAYSARSSSNPNKDFNLSTVLDHVSTPELRSGATGEENCRNNFPKTSPGTEFRGTYPDGYGLLTKRSYFEM
ncbi:MAG: hypothetical protein ACKVT2_14490 [Saprospiraceae bacterium]